MELVNAALNLFVRTINASVNWDSGKNRLIERHNSSLLILFCLYLADCNFGFVERWYDWIVNLCTLYSKMHGLKLSTGVHRWLENYKWHSWNIGIYITVTCHSTKRIFYSLYIYILSISVKLMRETYRQFFTICRAVIWSFLLQQFQTRRNTFLHQSRTRNELCYPQIENSWVHKTK